MNNYKISELHYNDYYNGFLQLLEQLTVVNANEISYEAFKEHMNTMKSKVFIIRNETNKVIATAAIFIEHKFIHKLSSVGHIEDVVVDLNYRGLGLGKMLVDYCVEYAKNNNCYKVILNCSNENVGFYEKCDFINKNVEMSLYIK